MCLIILVLNQLNLGDKTFSKKDIFLNIILISAFSDNEGMIFVTRNEYLHPHEKESTILFHRIYRNNWFYLGRYVFIRRNQAIDFTSVFMFQGQFLLYERVRKCTIGSTGPFSYCFNLLTLPPKIHLLDRNIDKFVEKKIILNYQNFDYFSIEL